MKRNTIFVDANLIDRIKKTSKEESNSMAEVIKEAMLRYIKKNA